MQGYEQNLVVVVELLLGAVTVMDVPVKNTYSLSFRLCNFGSYCNPVKNAESSSLTAFGMVPGRSGDAVASLKRILVVKHRLYSLNHS